MEYSMEYNQEPLQWVITSVILMDLMFDSRVMVWGEMRRHHSKGLKGEYDFSHI